jgi:AraC-like DNA-binding protein/mannose-6-phosphate isomerase-like protein (cupin superfamily)
MSQEYEIISHAEKQFVNIFLVHLISRVPHIHRDLELGLVLEGALAVQTGGKTYTIGKDDLYLINSMEAHEFASEGGCLILAMQFVPTPFETFLEQDERRRFAVDPPIRPYFDQDPARYTAIRQLCSLLALDYIGGESNGIRSLALAATLYSMLLESLPVQPLRSTDYLPLRRKTDRLVSVTDYIDANFRRKLLLEEVAEREGLSLYHLSHLFRDTLGISFQDYIKKKRFEYACRLISSTNMTILDISIDSGFSDIRYLNSLFKKEYGCTPSEYRARQTQDEPEQDFLSGNTQYFLSRDDSVSILLSYYRRLSADHSLSLADLFSSNSGSAL